MSAHDQTGRPDAYTRDQYGTLGAALQDALRVLYDLEDLAEGRTVVAVDEFTFVARRARQLVLACLRAEEEAG